MLMVYQWYVTGIPYQKTKGLNYPSKIDLLGGSSQES